MAPPGQGQQPTETLGNHPKYTKVGDANSSSRRDRSQHLTRSSDVCPASRILHRMLRSVYPHLYLVGYVLGSAFAWSLVTGKGLLLLQIRDLNSGTFGFVELAYDKVTGQQVAVKFIERGDKVRFCRLRSPSYCMCRSIVCS